MQDKPVILVAEDEPEITDVIKLYLERNGFVVLTAADGNKAMRLVQNERPDLIILDVLLPGRDGIEVCKLIRQISEAPIIFLSCKREETDKIAALNSGGDDYITKPFSPNELIARVRANLRRPLIGGKPQTETKLELGWLEIDRISRTVKIHGEEVVLSRKEFDLLCYLASRPDQTFTHEDLFREVWGQRSLNDTRTIIVHVSNLRKKIEPDPSNPTLIHNVHGIGYKFIRP